MAKFSSNLLSALRIEVEEGVEISHVDLIQGGEVVGTAYDGKKLQQLASRYPLAFIVARQYDALSSS